MDGANEIDLKPEQVNQAWDDIESETGTGETEPQDGEFIKKEQPTMSSADLLKPILKMIGSTLAPAWNIQESEYSELSNAYGGLLDKYSPDGDWMGKYAAEITALMVTGMFYAGHMGQDRMQPPMQANREDKNNDQT